MLLFNKPVIYVPLCFPATDNQAQPLHSSEMAFQIWEQLIGSRCSAEVNLNQSRQSDRHTPKFEQSMSLHQNIW